MMPSPSSAHGQRTDRSPPFPLLLALLGFSVVWVAAFWPALHDAWWYADDFWMGSWTSAERWGRFVLGNGRPIVGVWSYSYWLEGGASEWPNILLRWGQGGVHLFNAVLIASLLWEVMPSRAAILAVVPFLLWPFQADAVIWRAGFVYALAALFALAGLRLIRRQESRRNKLRWTAGSALCGLSMLTMQPSAFASLLVGCILVALTIMRPGPVPWRRLLREAAFVSSGVILGMVVSFWLIHSYPPFPPPFGGRAQLAPDLPVRLALLWELNKTVVFFPTFYPAPIKIVHGAIIGSALGALVAVIWRWTRARDYFLRRVLVLTLCLLGCVFFPYAAQVLVVGQERIVLRTLYLGPLLFTAGWLVSYLAWEQSLWLRRLHLGLLLALALLYLPIARRHAAEYVQSYAGDLAALHEVEQSAMRLGLRRVMVVPGMPFAFYNPYGLRYLMLCSHNSSLAYPWVREHFIRARSSLQPVCQPEDIFLLRMQDVDYGKVIMQAALLQKARLPPSSLPLVQKIDGHDVAGIFLP
ncbi:MAG: hypothetical protein ABI883_01285, partial [Chthoniobacterales bacterium]